MSARETYESHAPHYDLFTAHHDREAWTDTLERFCLGAGLAGKRMLDVACGTGKSFLPFSARGYQVSACDISPRMLSIAAEKARDLGIALSEQDMRRLPRLGAFDLVTCLDDAINYLDSTDELVSALTGMRRNLAPSGLLVFDVNTVAMYRSFFTISTVVQRPGVVLVWTGRSADDFRPGGRAEAEHLALEREPDGSWTRTVSIHRQRHFTRTEIDGALTQAGLRIVRVHGIQDDGSHAEGYDELGAAKAVFLATAVA